MAENEWQEFECFPAGGGECRTMLFAGDEVKLSKYAKNAHGTGTVVRLKRKNYAILFDGKEWSVPPGMIAKYKRSNGNFTPPAIVLDKAKIKTSKQRFYDECRGGDICLMYRGGSLFDVVEVIDFDKSRAKSVRCRVVGKSKTYRYDAAWYVQKLNGDRITTEAE